MLLVMCDVMSDMCNVGDVPAVMCVSRVMSDV